jgi:LmbE family N-acetylglucosaminyl deacetylase
MFNPSRILVLAPHTDDGELGCGASIATFIASGKELFYIAFSTCSRSLPKDFQPDTLSNECKKANVLLGVPENNITLFDFEVRELLFHRQAILEELILINKKLNPDLVLLPAMNDIHQDHQVVHAEGMRAFKNCNILGYELPWNNTRFQPNYFQKISPENLNKKIRALKAYESQVTKNYMQEDFIRSLAKVRGVQANCEYAEAFELYKLVSGEL